MDLKRKIGDTVILNEKFGKDEGREATIAFFELDKMGKPKWYRLRYRGNLDPWNWKDSDFKD